MKAIVTKYIGPTNTKGARVKASDMDGNSVIVSYDHASINPHRHAATALCEKMGWTGKLAEGGMGSGNVYVFIDELTPYITVEADDAKVNS